MIRLLFVSVLLWSLAASANCEITCDRDAQNACRSNASSQLTRLKDQLIPPLENRLAQMPSLVANNRLDLESAQAAKVRLAGQIGEETGRAAEAEKARQVFLAMQQSLPSMKTSIESARTVIEEALPNLLIEIRGFLDGQDESLQAIIADLYDRQEEAERGGLRVESDRLSLTIDSLEELRLIQGKMGAGTFGEAVRRIADPNLSAEAVQWVSPFARGLVREARSALRSVVDGGQALASIVGSLTRLESSLESGIGAIAQTLAGARARIDEASGLLAKTESDITRLKAEAAQLQSDQNGGLQRQIDAYREDMKKWDWDWHDCGGRFCRQSCLAGPIAGRGGAS